MRDNSNKWYFINNHPVNRPLSPEDVRYWKNTLAKLLKVGIEFEFNLPEQRGICKGDNVHCPCVNIDKDCWKKCSNEADCAQVPCMETCASKTSDCKYEDCATCKVYKLSCIGTNCVSFISACFSCDEFDKNCGTCSKKYDQKKDPKFIRQYLKDNLKPSGTYGTVGQTGVVNITTDGSLSGDKGAEVITVGRRPDYHEFYNMTRKILDMCTEKGAYINERCSSHMHLLTSYYDDDNGRNINELEREMPEIIVANFHQLCRRYQNAITWMTMALDKPNHMTRWEKFRVSILEFTPITKSMSEVASQIAGKSTKLANKEKYGWVNYNRMVFTSNNKISKFHVEMRVSDSTMCPSYYAGIACLFYALMIKAAEISRYGILKIGDEEWLNRTMLLKDAILNGTGGYDGARVGNTQHVLEYREEYTMQSVEMLNQLKGILIKLGPAYDVLIKLANAPVALRRVDGDKWADIERSLSVGMHETDQIEFRLNEIVDMRHIEDCKNIEEWVSEVSKIANDNTDLNVNITPDIIKSFIDNKMRNGQLIWSDTTGSLLSI